MRHSLILFCILALGTFTLSSAKANCYSEGIRVGTVQKFSKKGMVNKSWEGELVMEGQKVATGGRATTNVWAFSVLQADVAKVIDDSTMTGKSVALKYCQLGPFDITTQMDTKYEIVKAVQR